MWRVGKKWIDLSSVLKQMVGKLQIARQMPMAFMEQVLRALMGIVLM